MKRGENSENIRKRVIAAREIQQNRFAESEKKLNASMSHSQIEQFCKCTEEGRTLIHRYFKAEKLSARGYDRLLKVARTIADLNGAEIIGVKEIAEAISYKTKIL